MSEGGGGRTPVRAEAAAGVTAWLDTVPPGTEPQPAWDALSLAGGVEARNWSAPSSLI